MIEVLRNEINLIDKKIFILLKKRLAVVKKIKGEKIKNGVPVLDDERERKLLNLWQKIAKKEKLDLRFIKRLFHLVINESKRIQND